MNSADKSETSELLSYLTSQEIAEVDALLQPTATELSEKKTAAETSLHEFVQQAWPIVEPDVEFADGWHIEAICLHLEAVRRGEFRDLLINIPPGCMKSLLCCVFCPCWVWATEPVTRWMFASYSDTLSTRDSRKRRQIFDSEWFRGNWGDQVQFSADQNQKTRYENKSRGWMFSTSVGGGGLGEHPDFIVVDDPHKTKGAESEVQRQDVIDWWDGTIASRGVARGVKRIMIMQRLHEDDLSGHWLEGDKPVHICLPMEYEVDRMQPTPLVIDGENWTDPRTAEGELLWPGLMDEEKVVRLKEMGQFKVAGQLQQRPAPREGGMFKTEWLTDIVEDFPRQAKLVRYWDKAGTQDGGDYTAGVLMAAHLGEIYIVDVERGQWSSGARNQVMKQTAELDALKYGHVQVWTEQEPGSGGKESAAITVRELAAFSVHTERVTGSKEHRAEPFAAQCEAHNVHLVRGDWNADYIAEMCMFPFGKHDDQVDGSSGAYNKLILSGNRKLHRPLLDVTPSEERAYRRALRKGTVVEEDPLEGLEEGHWIDDI